MNASKGRICLLFGLMSAPVVATCDSLGRAIFLSVVLDLLLIPVALLSWLLPDRMPHGFRILSYSLAVALVYIPTAMLSEIFPSEWGLGRYLPILPFVAVLMVGWSKPSPKPKLSCELISILKGLLSLDFAVLAIGTLREALSLGTVLGVSVFETPLLPSFSTPALTMILLGVLGATGRMLHTWIGRLRKEADDADFIAD